MTISEVCEKLGLTQDTLRYYERIGLLPKVGKNAGGFREYTDLDFRRIAMIMCMRSAGMPIGDLAQYIELARSGACTVEARKKLLHELRTRLAERIGELQTTLRLLDERLEGYERKAGPEETELFRRKEREEGQLQSSCEESV